MEKRKWKEGTLIKGEELKDEILCKIMSENMVMKGFQYKIGMNEDTKPLAVKGRCKTGLHFCCINHILNYLGYGINLVVVRVSDEENVYVDNRKFRTHRLEVRQVMPLYEAATWEYILNHVPEFTEKMGSLLVWAADRGYLEVVKYFHQKGVDIASHDNLAIVWAAKNGHLETVKYLYENGADIRVDDHAAIRHAAGDNHMEIVKYLYENGLNITAKDNSAVLWAAEGNHFEMVKYLYENGADITARDNLIIMRAAENGNLEMVMYLHRKGADITVCDTAEIKNMYPEIREYLERNIK